MAYLRTWMLVGDPDRHANLLGYSWFNAGFVRAAVVSATPS